VTDPIGQEWQDQLVREYGDAPFTMAPEEFVQRYQHTFTLGTIFTANHPDPHIRAWAHRVYDILVPNAGPGIDVAAFLAGEYDEPAPRRRTRLLARLRRWLKFT
jgi:hypothetical protein